jgi:Domain of unknown function (DUF6265)
MRHLKSTIFLFLIFGSSAASAQNNFASTMAHDESIGSPAADLSATSWVAGHWRGKAFGGITEEVWTSPLGGSMMGSFKLVVDGKVNFYELITLSEVEGTLILKLKHFNANLTGWEEKDETVEFKLVKVTPNKVFFDHFTFEKISNDEINMYVVVDNDGEKTEVKFNYVKQN